MSTVMKEWRTTWPRAVGRQPRGCRRSVGRRRIGQRAAHQRRSGNLWAAGPANEHTGATGADLDPLAYVRQRR